MCIQGLLLSLNGLKIINTLCVYFEYNKVQCKFLIKYIATILQVYTSYVIILLKILQMPCIIIIIIYINQLIISFVLKNSWLKININNILLHNDDDDTI
jgi:hypothetical protein